VWGQAAARHEGLVVPHRLVAVLVRQALGRILLQQAVVLARQIAQQPRLGRQDALQQRVYSQVGTLADGSGARRGRRRGVREHLRQTRRAKVSKLRHRVHNAVGQRCFRDLKLDINLRF
jgi:hypothetical protein